MKTLLKILLITAFIALTSIELSARQRIKHGDQVRLRIVGIIDKLYPVDAEGYIDFDLMGKVKVENLTREQTIEAIKEKLSKYLKFKKTQVFLSIKKKIIKKKGIYVSVFGEVHTPDTFPYNKSFKVLDYIILSGGPTRFALSDAIKIVCFKNGRMKTDRFNLQAFSAGKKTKMPRILPGCMIYVPEKPAEEASWMRNGPDQVIHVLGQVMRPGRYQFNEEFRFADILSHAGGITLEADPSKVSIISGKKVRYFNLEKYLARGGNSPMVYTGDIIYVPSLPKSHSADWIKTPSQKSIYLIGEIVTPGRYDYLPSLSFLDFLAHAGGPTAKADTKRIIINRGGKLVQTFDFFNYQKNVNVALPELQPEDLIIVSAIEPQNWIKKNPAQVINILGEVNKPGRFEVEPANMNFLDILSAAGGPKNQADISRIKIIRRNTDINLENQVEKKDVIVFDFEKYQENGDVSNLPKIQLGDTIFIPKQGKSFWEEFKTIGGSLGVIVLTLAILL